MGEKKRTQKYLDKKFWRQAFVLKKIETKKSEKDIKRNPKIKSWSKTLGR